MPGILCFRNFHADPIFKTLVTDATAGGTPDPDHPPSLLIDGRADTYYRRVGFSLTYTLRSKHIVNPLSGTSVIGIVGVEAVSASGSAQTCWVSVRVGTSVGASDLYQGSRRIVASSSQSTFFAPLNAFFVIDPMTAQPHIDAGGLMISPSSDFHVEWVIRSSAGIVELRVRELTAWTGLAGGVRPNRAFGGIDLSEMQRSFGGAEQVFVKPTKREHSFTFNNLDDRQVYGGARGPRPVGTEYPDVVAANVAAVNLAAGTHSAVVMVPHADIGESGYADDADAVGRNWDQDYRAQSEIVYGFLTRPMVAREVARVAEGSMWEADITLVDAFNGVN